MAETAPLPASAAAAKRVDLDKLLATQSRGLYACIERETATRPDFGGHLDAEIEIDTRGRVVNVQIATSTFPDDSALPCLLRAWRDLRLSPPHERATGRMRIAWENECSSRTVADTGSMDKEMIRRIIQSHLDEVRFCYEKKLVKNATLQGRVMIQFTIGHAGTVAAAIVQNSTIDDADVGSCIASATHGWRFPQTCGGIVIVSYPFVLRTAGAAP